EGRVDSFHHVLGARARVTQQARTRIDVRRQQVAFVAVPVSHHDLGRAGGNGTFDRRVGLTSHDRSEMRIVGLGRIDVVAGNNAGETFHVYRDENLETAGLLGMGDRR